MIKYKLENFINGWFIGNFEPSVFNTREFEVAIKKYNKTDKEMPHYQLFATEITVVVSGEINLGSEKYATGDIIVIEPLEVADFQALTDVTLVCIKFPSDPNDKIMS